MSITTPTSYPVSYYAWDDDSAPQLDNADGSIKTIIKACLVTGYGSKAGAGWEQVYDDADKLVLNRALKTGEPPSIKIVNGGGVHKICSQSNPTSIDDDDSIAAVDLPARQNRSGNKWHLIACDAAFLFVYEMRGDSNRQYCSNVVYVGSIKKWRDADSDIIVISGYNNPKRQEFEGIPPSSDVIGLGTRQSFFFNAKTADVYRDNHFISLDQDERYYNDNYMYQRVLVSNVGELPFYFSIGKKTDNFSAVKFTDNNGRPMLRVLEIIPSYRNKPDAQIMYVPLDNWEI